MNQVQRALLLGGVVLAGVVLATQAFAHNDVILKCSNQKVATRLSDGVLPNGLFIERYDTNGDGRPDVLTLSHTTATKQLGGGKVEVEHTALPVFYVVDLDLDGEPDKIFVDTVGDGGCGAIAEYQDLTGPQTDDAIKRGGIVSGTL